MKHNFQDKRILVAGGTSGINLGIAQSFADAGADVAVLSRSQDKVAAAVADLRGRGVRAAGRAVDVRAADALAEAIAALAEELGRFHVVVSGAAGNFPAPALGMSSNGFKSVVDIDLLGTFNVARHVYEHLEKPGASLINISAPQAEAPTPLQIHVCAAKAGVDMVTRVLAMEWGSMGVRVNGISPGPIDGTEGMRRLASNTAVREHTLKSVPLGRFGTPQDIGKAALFLASDDASYITGTVLAVDGGWSLGGSSGFFPR